MLQEWRCSFGTLTRLIPAEFCNSSAIFAVAGFGLAFGLIYRIYQFEKTESEGKASEGAGEDDPEKRDPSPQRSEESAKKGKKGKKHAVAPRREMEKMEQSIREEREDFLREKQMLEELKAEEERQRRIEADRRREIKRRQLAELAIRIAMTRLKEEVYPSEKKKPSTKEKAADSVPPKTPDDPKQPSTFLKSRRTPPAAAAQPVLPRTTSNGFDIGPLKREICPFCDSDNIFNDPVAAIQHIVGHGASIADLEFIFFEDDKFIAAEPQVSGEKCNVCDISFAFATLFYIHLLTTHRSALALFYQPLYPNANNVKILTELVYRKFPEHTIQFREIIPKLAMRD